MIRLREQPAIRARLDIAIDPASECAFWRDLLAKARAWKAEQKQQKAGKAA
jgi:hypothetical protein